jgi:cysteinyl-tRNA synthetase
LNLPATAEDEEAAKKIDDEFNACMADDFNTALALSNLFGYAKEINKFIAAKDGKATAYAKQIQKTYALLGVFTRTPEEYAALFAEEESGIPADVQAIAEERWAARQNRDWAKSDELRDKLSSMGYAVKDSKTGYELTKI